MRLRLPAAALAAAMLLAGCATPVVFETLADRCSRYAGAVCFDFDGVEPGL